MKIFNKILPVLAVITIIGFSGIAFSHGGFGDRGWGMGFGRHMMNDGYHMGWNDPDRFTGNQYKEFDQAREKFYNETRKLRDQIYDKNLELRRELAENNPDVTKAKELQKQLSALEKEFDQKRLDHQLEIRKIAPDYDRGYSGRGYGPRGGGYCRR